jgi:hypothetical protein
MKRKHGIDVNRSRDSGTVSVKIEPAGPSGDTELLPTTTGTCKPKFSIPSTSKKNPTQPTLVDFTNKMPITSSKSMAIHRSVGEFIATDLRPYSIVESSGFIKLLNTLEPRYSVPSRPFFSGTIIPGIYNELKQELLLELSKALGISLTTDGWTSKATESYITTTAHYVTDNWTLGESP